MHETSLQFHIEKNDFFDTVATVLDLVSQDLRKKGHPSTAETLLRQRDRLMYLQREYRIENPSRTVNFQPAVAGLRTGAVLKSYSVFRDPPDLGP